MPETTSKPAFTLRFESSSTHDLLRQIAKIKGVSMNTLAERMIERELQLEIGQLDQQLTATLEMLRSYETPFDVAWDEFARAEGAVSDPVQAQRIEPDADPFGIAAAFG